MSSAVSVTFVVMAGGKGERLWPLVRANRPKVCLSVDGQRSLIEATLQRLRLVWPAAQCLVVTTQGQADLVRAALPAALRQSVIVEPQAKNTAACITLAAVALGARSPQRIMVVVPADHWVGSTSQFQKTLRCAIRAAVAYDTIVTIGIPPKAPHPGLGYLCTGARLEGFRSSAVFQMERFIEKPSRQQASELIRKPQTFWNSGIFVATADKFLEYAHEWLPDNTRRLARLGKLLARYRTPVEAMATPSILMRVKRTYQALRSVSFDRGIMCHLRQGLVVQGDFPWADLGSWDNWVKAAPNACRLVNVESGNITAIGREDHLVAAVGVRNLLVVHTANATLLCHPQKAQAVRDLVKRLARNEDLARFL